MIAKPLAFLRRDLGIAVSYRLQFAESLVTLVFSVVSLELVSRLINQGSPAALHAYGRDYFAFALIGLGTVVFAQSVAAQFPAAIRGAQVTGTLEVITASRTSLPAFLGCSALYGSADALMRLFATLAIGVLFLGASLKLGALPLAFLVLLMTTATFVGLGVLAAAFTARFNQSQPFTGAFISASLLLSGVFYPVTVLPDWLEVLAPLLPLTHAIELLRGALLDAGPSAGMDHMLILAGFSLLLPLSLVAFEWAVRGARAEGTLAYH